jgi:hypothetical protein
MRTICALLALLVFPTVALADLASSVAALDAALDARITAIGDPAPTKAEKKESKKLQKARKALAKYTGANDVGDLKALGKAGKSIVKSKTTDAAIEAAVEDVLDDVLAIVLAHKDQAMAAAAGLVTSKFVDKVNKKIASAQDVLDEATPWIGVDAARALGFYRKSLDKFLSALGKAVKLEKKDNGGGGGGGSWPGALTVVNSPFGFYIQNNAFTRYYVSDVILTGTVKERDSGAHVANVNGLRVRSVAPGIFDGQINLVEKRFGNDPAILHDLFEYLGAYHDVLGTPVVLAFTGDFEIRLSKKNDGKSTYTKVIQVTDRWF